MKVSVSMFIFHTRDWEWQLYPQRLFQDLDHKYSGNVGRNESQTPVASLFSSYVAFKRVDVIPYSDSGWRGFNATLTPTLPLTTQAPKDPIQYLNWRWDLRSLSFCQSSFPSIFERIGAIVPASLPIWKCQKSRMGIRREMGLELYGQMHLTPQSKEWP